jgi:2-polyprenyl-3-methyl-5-hydroxy-6-metoxy-1,4-benzoquinol methylase
MLPQDIINQVFREIYNSGLDDRHLTFTKFKYSGYGLLAKIGPTEKVLDVGCGRNLFNKHFPNLIGIDPVTTEADHQVALLDYVTEEKFDVILCLGSVHFGELEDIKESIAHMSSMLNPGGRIYWRCGTTSELWWNFAWSRTLHTTLSTEFGFTLADIQDDYMSLDLPETFRIYAEWVKN